MRISKFIHSCLLVETANSRVLIDPGSFTFLEGLASTDQFDDLSAILFTHVHPDHLDEESLSRILENNAAAILISNQDVSDKLLRRGLTVEVLERGTRELGATRIEAIDAPHAEILGSTPPRNTAFLIDDALLHPGDSFAGSLEDKAGVSCLALPIMAPWTNELEVAKFAERMMPKQIIPIHDGYAKPFFVESRHTNFARYFSAKSVEFHPLAEPGALVEID